MSIRKHVIPGRNRRALAVSAATFASFLGAAAPATASPTAETVAHPALPQVVCTSAKPGLAAQLTNDINTVVQGNSTKGSTSVALYDRTTKTQCTYDEARQYDSASVVKVIVLGSLLRQTQDENRELTSTERQLTTKMITESDNDATTALWRQLGLTRIQDFLQLAGMNSTVPDPDGYWGLTQINAHDEIKLMALLTSSNVVLDEDSRAYALDLMNRVIPSQRWGVPAGAPSGATVHVKNGWLQRSAGGWRVNSVGAFTGKGYDYGIVVLTADGDSMASSVNVIEDIARKVHTDLNGSTAAGKGRSALVQNLPTTSDGSLTPDNSR